MIRLIKDNRFLDKQKAFKYHWFKAELETKNFQYHLVLNKKDRRSCRVIEKRQQPKIDLLYDKFKNLNYDFFIDLGTNYGEFSIPLSKIVKKVISIEPNPEIYRTFLETKKNYENIDSFQNAFFNEITKIDLFKNSSQSGGCFIEGSRSDIDGKRKTNFKKFFDGLIKDPNHKNYDVIEVSTINFEYLNNYYNFSNKKIIVKIDVEGMDLQFMKNFTQKFLKLDVVPSFFIISEIGSNYKYDASIDKLSEFINYCLENNINVGHLKNKNVREGKNNIDLIRNLSEFIDYNGSFDSGELIVFN